MTTEEMSKDNVMVVCMTLIDWLIESGYYKPEDTNQPVRLLTDMTDYMYVNFFGGEAGNRELPTTPEIFFAPDKDNDDGH